MKRLVALAVALALVAPAAADANPRSVAYGILSKSTGKWNGPRHADGAPDMRIVDHILRARPSHLRATPASHKLEQNLAPADPYVAEAWRRFRKAGIKLGAAITAKRDPDEVVEHGCRIKAEAGQWYQWLFLDFASASVGGIGAIVKRLRKCGWRVVWINASGGSPLPRAAYAAAKRFEVVGNAVERRFPRWKRQARRIARGKAPALHVKDRRWVRRARKRGVNPILKLEVPHQTGLMFAQLPKRIQRKVLRRWHVAAKRYRFDFIYPLYVHGVMGRKPYDSRAMRTATLQRRLIP